MCKVLAFCSAMYDGAAAQIRQGVMLARVFGNWDICDNWEQWSQALNVYEVPAPHYAMAKRKRGAERLPMWRMARINMRKNTMRLRVAPYTQKRVNVYRRGRADHSPLGGNRNRVNLLRARTDEINVLTEYAFFPG